MSLTYSPTQIAQIDQLNRTFEAILTPFIGEKFSWVRVSYGDETKLNFGKEIIKTFRSGRTQKKGEWILTTSASCWELKQNDQKLLDDSVFEGEDDIKNKEQVAKVFEQLIGESIQSVKLQEISTGIQTVMAFTNNFSFVISPQTEIPELTDLWRLFMPTEQVLVLSNRAPFWSCHSIHRRFQQI